jgi:hypothetical protein
MRKPVAIGFYPNNPKALETDVKKYLFSDEKIKNPLGAVVPHAGYVFSGAVAGSTFKAAENEKRNFIILCPNHTGYGSAIATSKEDWQTPLGVVKTNKAIADKLGIEINEGSHKYEHSAEVQLPFLQVLYKNFTIVPICLSDAGIEELNDIADALAAFRSSSFYIASSDFIHFGTMYAYEPVSGSIEDQVEWVKKKDTGLIERICKLDAEGFYNEITENGYTVCGFVPITLLLLVMKKIGAKKGKLIKYMTSYDTQPNSSFVSYAGIVFD